MARKYIHDFEGAARSLKRRIEQSDLSAADKSLLANFEQYCAAENLSLPRCLLLRQRAYVLATRFIRKPLQSVRKSDLVARYGGEEFIILFPETPLDPVLNKLEELRKRIEVSGVTISIGVASMPDDGTEIRTVIDTADRRLYEAKRSGRNRLVGPSGVVGQRGAAEASVE